MINGPSTQSKHSPVATPGSQTTWGWGKCLRGVVISRSKVRDCVHTSFVIHRSLRPIACEPNIGNQSCHKREVHAYRYTTSKTAPYMESAPVGLTLVHNVFCLHSSSTSVPPIQPHRTSHCGHRDGHIIHNPLSFKFMLPPLLLSIFYKIHARLVSHLYHQSYHPPMEPSITKNVSVLT